MPIAARQSNTGELEPVPASDFGGAPRPFDTYNPFSMSFWESLLSNTPPIDVNPVGALGKIFPRSIAAKNLLEDTKTLNPQIRKFIEWFSKREEPVGVSTKAKWPEALGTTTTYHGTDPLAMEISIDPTLDPFNARRTLVHELGHAYDMITKQKPAENSMRWLQGTNPEMATSLKNKGILAEEARTRRIMDVLFGGPVKGGSKWPTMESSLGQSPLSWSELYSKPNPFDIPGIR